MITVNELEKSYNGLKALDKVSFSVEQGEIFGLLGPNGAGKTTTLKILCGMIPADGGDATISGYSVTKEPMDVKSIIGLVPESGALYENLTAMEFLDMVGNLRLLEPGLIRERIEHFAGFLDLKDEELVKRMSGFSKGMKQKVLITAALLHNPDVVFLDEPLSGLDANMALKIKELVRMLANQGKTFVFSSHVLDVIERTCDRIAILVEGRIHVGGTVTEIIEQTGQGTLEHAFHQLTSTEDVARTTSEFLRGLDKKDEG
jgi:ABC-2 type transport system ATP-binding protein